MTRATVLIPIMDGVPGHDRTSNKTIPKINKLLIRQFADFVYSTHHYRNQENLKDSMVVKNSHNLGEMTFVDSSQSRLLQHVDIASHLLLQIDRENLEPTGEISTYRKAVLECARQIDERLVTSIKTKMKFD